MNSQLIKVDVTHISQGLLRVSCPLIRCIARTFVFHLRVRTTRSLAVKKNMEETIASLQGI